jgi:membrane protease YdiL (CAAX protease family)
MLENSSNTAPSQPRRTYFWRSLGLIFWVIAGFVLASLIVAVISGLLVALGLPVDDINESVLNTAAAGLVYLLSALIVIGGPQLVRGFRTTRHELGLPRLPSWRDILFAPAAFVVYFIATSIVTTIVATLVPGFNLNETQDVGFANLTLPYEYILAFLTLVVLAPVAEELLFRGYLYGKLRRWVSVWTAALVTSVVFGVVHGQWNVGVDVFVLSLVMCSLREMTGSIWAGILLHMLKNGLAFYILFINPTLLNTIGG